MFQFVFPVLFWSFVLMSRVLLSISSFFCDSTPNFCSDLWLVNQSAHFLYTVCELPGVFVSFLPLSLFTWNKLPVACFWLMFLALFLMFFVFFPDLYFALFGLCFYPLFCSLNFWTDMIFGFRLWIKSLFLCFLSCLLSALLLGQTR